MKALIFRELKTVFCSPAGAFFALAFLLTTGFLLWFFSGNYNIIDGGYAEVGNFFNLAPILLSILIPALTMRLFAEEKRNKTLNTLIARPVSAVEIYFSKFSATFIFVFVTLLSTCIYIYSLSQLAYPIGSLDYGSIIISYISLLLLSVVFITIGLFGSIITKNQIVALIVSIALCLFFFYGFELLRGIVLSGKMSTILASFGLSYHFKLMQRGVVQVSDVLTMVNYLIIFSLFSILILSKSKKRILLILTSTISILNVFSFFIPNYRCDFTADKRYTLNEYSISLMKQVKNGNSNLKITVFLNGDLNYGFQHLRNETDNLLSDLNRYADGEIEIQYTNPFDLHNDINEVHKQMSENGMDGIVLNETDREGKASMKVIYPYAQVANSNNTLVVPLLKNITGYSAEESLNASIESLEFEFVDAIRLLNQKGTKNIAFIEGHGELERNNVYDAEVLLSKYYSVNRGQIGHDIGVLDNFSAIIIAGPLTKYSETEKYIIDQYIMSGGKVLWLVDGVYYSHEELANSGQSPSMKNEVNLDDMLFIYGVRINPDLIQDLRCISTYMVSNESNQPSILIPSYYQSLLMPSPDHPVTKSIKDVKGGFVSSINVVNNTPEIKKNILLTSSPNTHLVKVPEMIDFDVERIQNTEGYFDQSFIPTAISLEGSFNSVFMNRIIPDSVNSAGYKTINKSEETKMIVVSSSDIISNGMQGQEGGMEVIPMGYDWASRQIFGNRDFIVNAVNWLTDDDGIMELRTKQQKLYTLDKKTAYENRDKYAILNIAFPVLFMLLVIGGTYIYRKRKYEK